MPTSFFFGGGVLPYTTQSFVVVENCDILTIQSRVLTCSSLRKLPPPEWPWRMSPSPRPNTPARLTWRRSLLSRSPDGARCCTPPWSIKQVTTVCMDSDSIRGHSLLNYFFLNLINDLRFLAMSDNSKLISWIFFIRTINLPFTRAI